MAQTFMIFDFGTNEEAAQQARHKIERWKQGFRLGDKMTVKFEREQLSELSGAEDGEEGDEVAVEKKPAKAQKGKKAAKESKRAKGATEAKDNEAGGNVRVLVRLGFSDHEKLSQQRWLDRIPTEEPFKSAKGETIRHSDPEFDKSAELFDSLD